MGWGILLVLFRHCDEFIWPKNFELFLKHIVPLGNVGVELFLFVSGIGLFYSIQKNSIVDFYKRRFLRVIPEYILITGIGFLIVELLGSQSITDFFYRFSTLSIWQGDGAVWYIPFILICYLFYPIAIKIVNNLNGLTISLLFTYLVLFTMAFLFPVTFINLEQPITRIPIFLIGCHFGVKVYYGEKSSLMLWRGFIVLFIVLRALKILFFSNYCYEHIIIRTANIFLALFLIWLICGYLNKVRLVSFLGTISLELYLVHRFINMIYILLPIYHGFVVYFLIIIPLSVIISFYLHKLYEKYYARKEI